MNTVLCAVYRNELRSWAIAGAAACGVLALLVSRSGTDILRSMQKETNLIGERTESLFCCVGGIAAGLLLAFGQGMWSQAVIAEVYSLNIFFQTLILLFLFEDDLEERRFTRTVRPE